MFKSWAAATNYKDDVWREGSWIICTINLNGRKLKTLV